MSETGNDYRDVADLPTLVRAAADLAARMGFRNSCTPEVGRLLRVLTAARPGGRVGESGTGCGVGAAWIIGGLDLSASFITVEQDAERAAAARNLFAVRPNVRVLHGDWRDLAAYGPFSLLFLDGGGGKSADQEDALAMVAPGGLVVLDDLTPDSRWPAEWRAPGWVDPVRSWWLRHPAVATTEILTTPEMAVILAVRTM